MDTFATGLPNARVLVASILNVYRVWKVLKDNAAARSAWSSGFLCRAMFENPLSTDQADVDRRARVRQRMVDYNTQLAEVCAAYTRCRFDDNTVFNLDLVASDIGTSDYVHPSTQWHTKVAAGLWPFVTPGPTVTVMPASGPKGTPVALSGTAFAPGEQVNVKYKTGLTSPKAIMLCTAVPVAGDGNFSCHGAIPTTNQGPKGAHTIVAKGTTSLIKAKTTFTRT
jgi:hypothetical protein